MSTHCIIAEKLINGKIRSVYCHNSGDIQYVGKILNAYWNFPDAVTSLINQGGISVLGIREGRKVSFDRYWTDIEYHRLHEEQCIFYNRDRGEEKEIRELLDYDDIRKMYYGEFRYIYLYDHKTRQWLFCHPTGTFYNNPEKMPLSEAIRLENLGKLFK